MATKNAVRTSGEYKDRSNARATYLRIVLTVILANLATAIAFTAAKLVHIDFGAALFDLLVGKEKTVAIAVKGAILSTPALFAFAVFALWAWKLTGAMADRLAVESFGEFRADLFLPLDGADRATGIFKPPGSNAEAVFDGIVGFARDGAAQKRKRIAFHRAEELFAWTVITGQSGAGKTAIAEAAARELSGAPLSAKSSAIRRRLRRWRAWLREEVPFLPRDTHAAWDVGRIRIAQDARELLRHWKPRRPTLLLLEDPAPGVAKDVLLPLSEGCGEFRKPVRLLFVNQTLPSELLLTWSGERPASSKISGFRLPPPVVEQFGTMTDENTLKSYMVHVAAAKRYKDFWPKLYKSRDFGELYRAIEGNPLLAEMAVELIEEGVAIVDLSTRSEILDRRAQQVIEKLDLVGLHSAADRKAVAVATLAQGPRWDRWERALDPDAAQANVPAIDRMIEAFPYAPETPMLVDYRRRLVHDATLAPPPVPYVRPDLLGESVLNIWASASGPQSARALASDWVKTAWSAGGGVFNSVQRRKGQKSALALALSQPPGRDAFADGRTYASVLFDGATRSGWALEDLPGALAGIDDDELVASWDVLRTAIEAPAAKHDYALACLSIYVEVRMRKSATAAVPPLAITEIGGLFLHIQQLPWMGDDLSFEPYGRVLGESIAALWLSSGLDWTRDETERAAIFACVHTLKLPADSAVVMPLLSQIEAAVGSEAFGQIAHALADTTAAHSRGAQGRAAAAAHAATARLEGLVALDPTSTYLQELRARAWANTGHAESRAPNGVRVEAVREATQRIADIAQSLGDNVTVLTQLSQAWKDVAFAETQMPDGVRAEAAREAAANIEPIARLFPENATIQLNRAIAWKIAAYADSELPGGIRFEQALVAARLVETIAQSFPDDEGIQAERIHSLLNACRAQCNVPHGARAGSARAMALEIDALASRYPRNEDIQLSRILAWINLENAERMLPDYARPGVTGETARHAEKIAAGFPQSESIQNKSCEIWECTAVAAANAPGGPYLALMHEAAESIERIARVFPGSDAMQLLRIVGWKLVAFGEARASDAPNVKAIRRIAERVDAIAQPFAGNDQIQLHRAATWENLMEAEFKYVDAARPARVRAIARHVETMALPFPDCDMLQHERAHVWRVVAYAESEVPFGGGASAAREAALKIDDIAGPFAGDERMQDYRAQAWNHVAYAEGQAPAGMRAQVARDAAEQIEDIARPFPGSAAIQGSLARAWVNVGYAESRVPGGAHAGEAREAALRVDAVGKNFPEPLGFQDLLQTAQNNAAYAEAELAAGRTLH